MNQPNHDDYAEEAESAERAEAWPQAAALWRRAACQLRESAPHATETPELHAKYLATAETCDLRHEAALVLEKIARNVLKVPTLRCRHSDHLDFHELSVGQIRRALFAAYQAGFEDAK